MAKRLFSLFLFVALAVVCLPGAAQAGKLSRKEKGKYGTTYWGKYDNAPFPAKGHKYKDNTIAAFVPKHFCSTLMRITDRSKKRTRRSFDCYSSKRYKKLKKRRKVKVRKHTYVDYVVHFHGHSNTVEKTFRNHKIREQFSLSLQNAILVVPQGPVNSIDSAAGKLERRKGFRKMMFEVHRLLQEQGVIGKDQKIGHIIITSHSGGYLATAMCLKHGGLEVSEVFLFDSLYAYNDVFFKWISEGGDKGRRFINVYYRKKPRARSKELLSMLKKGEISVLHVKESRMRKKNFQRKKLTRAKVIFIHTDQGHSKCTRGNYNYRDYLFSSNLKRVKSTDWFNKSGLDKMKKL